MQKGPSLSGTALRQHRTIPALRLKHRSGGSPRQEPPQAAVALRSASLRLGVRHGICVAKMLDNVGLRYPHRASGQKPLALCDRCPCFGSLHPPLAALTFAASSIICAFGLAATVPCSPYRHLELCGIAPNIIKSAPRGHPVYAAWQPADGCPAGGRSIYTRDRGIRRQRSTRPGWTARHRSNPAPAPAQ